MISGRTLRIKRKKRGVVTIGTEKKRNIKIEKLGILNGLVKSAG